MASKPSKQEMIAVAKIRRAIMKVADGTIPVLWLTGSEHWAAIAAEMLPASNYIEGEITSGDLLYAIEDSRERTLILTDEQLPGDENAKFTILFSLNSGAPIQVYVGESEEIEKTIVRNKGGIIVVSKYACPTLSDLDVGWQMEGGEDVEREDFEKTKKGSHVCKHMNAGYEIFKCKDCEKITIVPDKDTLLQKHPKGARTCKGRIVDLETTVHIYFCKHCQAPGFHAITLPLDPDFEEEGIKFLRPMED